MLAALVPEQRSHDLKVRNPNAGGVKRCGGSFEGAVRKMQKALITQDQIFRTESHNFAPSVSNPALQSGV